jgi:hypothetical protein
LLNRVAAKLIGRTKMAANSKSAPALIQPSLGNGVMKAEESLDQVIQSDGVGNQPVMTV